MPGDPLSTHRTAELQGTLWSVLGSHGNVGGSEATPHLFDLGLDWGGWG